ncbi:MAG TPA: hypothetical protein VIJ00_13325 [Nakamurella sp.]
MATVVFVHGIAQEQLSADSMETVWLPALAGGVRNAGNHQLADQLWRDARPGGMTTRMAFYGDFFLTPGSQGTPPAKTLDSEAQDLAEQLAQTCRMLPRCGCCCSGGSLRTPVRCRRPVGGPFGAAATTGSSVGCICCRCRRVVTIRSGSDSRPGHARRRRIGRRH